MQTAGYKITRQYVGPVKACILDLGGTVVDKYVIAPAAAFVGVFKKYNIEVTMTEARGPMGIRKDLHIKEMSQMPRIRKKWHEIHGRFPNQSDIDAMYKDFVPMQLEILPKYADLIPGTAKAIDTLKTDLQCKIGATTGFTREMVDIILPVVSKQGYHPDSTVAGDECKNGSRPKPHMIYKNMDLLDIDPIQAVVKVDDTVTGIHEASAAGCWGVGVARYSNYMNINSSEEEDKLSSNEIESRLEISRETLRNGGAHYVIDSVVELPAVVADINLRLARGERP